MWGQNLKNKITEIFASELENSRAQENSRHS